MANQTWCARVLSCSTALLLALAAAACGDDGDPSGTGAGGGGPTAQTFADSDCGVCVKASCATAVDACLTDPGCTAYLGCLNDCPVDDKGFIDPACDQACAPESSSEATRIQAELVECRLFGAGAACAECGLPSNPFSPNPTQMCEPRPERAPNACRECYWEKCCDTWDACYAPGVNPDCDALNTCISMCTTPPLDPCVEACLQAYPSGVEPLFAQLACAADQCAIDTAPNCDPTERDACEACLYGGTCGTLWVELLSDPEGFLLFACLGDCGSVDGGIACLEACFDAHPSAESAGYLWSECISYQCDSIC